MIEMLTFVFSLLRYPVTMVGLIALIVYLLYHPVTVVQECHVCHPVTIVNMFLDHLAGLPVFVWAPLSPIVGGLLRGLWVHRVHVVCMLHRLWLDEVRSSAEKSGEPKQEDFPPVEPVVDTRPVMPMTSRTREHNAMIVQCMRFQYSGEIKHLERSVKEHLQEAEDLRRQLRSTSRELGSRIRELIYTRSKVSDMEEKVGDMEEKLIFAEANLTTVVLESDHSDLASIVYRNRELHDEIDQVKGQLHSEKEKHQHEVNSLTQLAEQKHQEALAGLKNEYEQKLAGFVEQARVETLITIFADCQAVLAKKIKLGHTQTCSSENQCFESQVDQFREQVRQDTFAECQALLEEEWNRVRSQTREATQAECEAIIVEHVNQGRIKICDAEVYAKVAHRCPNMAPPVKDLSFDLNHMENAYDQIREEKVSIEQKLEQQNAELTTAQAAIEWLKLEVQKSDASQAVLTQERQNAEKQRQAAAAIEIALFEAQQENGQLKQELARVETENRQVTATSETTKAHAQHAQRETERLKQELAWVDTEHRQLAAASDAKNAHLQDQVDLAVTLVTGVCRELETEQGASFDPMSGLNLADRLKGLLSAQKQKHEEELQSSNDNYNLASNTAQAQMN
ncbi:hypothetical protein N7478_009988 [Penicillium angulare]|uniref:uncharacterized protein n=1 Tax=Penicillium angulare TaxID=116970 RepID=UPI002540F0C5|nr:uncharacterized protein N7478_009988 [Penicillium angulare]KAJ5267180.1 hypothetical protein N7478_009988 [Penicillium angulare]